MASQPIIDEPEAMTDAELAAMLAEHETNSLSYYESEIASAQADNLDRYYRRPYGDEREGRSSVVDGTVAITVDNALAAVLKPFVSSEETVAFQPRGPEDEEAAGQATEYVNYVLHQDNPGFLILHNWFKDALTQILGVAKVYWEDTTREKIVRLDRLDAMQVELLAKEGVIVGGPYGPDEEGLFVADVAKTDPDGKLCVETVPPEEYRISPLARPGRVPPYEAHVTNKPRSDLIELGFDPEVVASLSKANQRQDDSRYISRYRDEDWDGGDKQTPGDKSRELVAFNDEYVLVDYDGDGISELRHVIRSGNVVLYNEEVEYSAFARLCPVPMPHKTYGMCPADQVKDEQRISTVLWRQTLDNLYLSNNPHPELPEAAERADGTTIDDLLSNAPGSVIRTRQGGMLKAFSVPFVADKSFPMLGYAADQAETRSGISRHGQGMDPNAIDKAGQISATQAAIMEDGRNARAEMIARIFAETGVRDLYRLMLKNLIDHQPRARMIRLRNKWVEIDPRSWNADMDVTISVGLGMGNKAQQMAASSATLELMERLGQTPFATMIDAEKVYNASKRFLNAAGVKNVDDFLNEPQPGQEPPTPPDPEMMKLQAELKMQQAKVQGEQQLQAAKLAGQQQQAAAQIELDRQKAEADIILEREKNEANIELARDKALAEIALAEQKFQAEMALAARKQTFDAASEMSENREGGRLDE